ncbi:MAG: ABC transporter ATP-binding protein [Rhizobiaceae bacterium]
MECLEGRKIHVRFAGLSALDDVTISLPIGTILGLIGPNGAGKTTLVNVLTGFQQPTGGSVAVDGVPVGKIRPERYARLGVARTFQSVRLFRDLSVAENIEVAMANAGAGVERKAADLLEWVGLGDRGSVMAGQLAYGEERMLGIARALALRPRYLLLDEPAAGLNDHECLGLIRRIGEIPERYGCGVMLIEHNMQVVMAVSHRVHVIEHGRTIAVDTPDVVKSHPEVLRAYLG